MTEKRYRIKSKSV